jgi:hypothetical protein
MFRKSEPAPESNFRNESDPESDPESDYDSSSDRDSGSEENNNLNVIEDYQKSDTESSSFELEDSFLNTYLKQVISDETQVDQLLYFLKEIFKNDQTKIIYLYGKDRCGKRTLMKLLHSIYGKSAIYWQRDTESEKAIMSSRSIKTVFIDDFNPLDSNDADFVEKIGKHRSVILHSDNKPESSDDRIIDSSDDKIIDSSDDKIIDSSDDKIIDSSDDKIIDSTKIRKNSYLN